MLIFKITYVIINVFSCWFIRPFVSTFIPAGKYRLFLWPEGSPSVSLVKHHQSIMSSHAEVRFISSWWCKIYTTVLRGTREMKSENPICEGKNGVYEKRSNARICQKLIIYVSTGWRQLAREYCIKLIMVRWLCISEILIILAVHVCIQTRICAECSTLLPVHLCSDPVTDTRLKCSCYL